ncbi:MAG: TRAM domain-containing protein [Actinomycetota bacterium]|nr:TRAM domain-containing protein [Actinomycetota bacterium]
MEHGVATVGQTAELEVTAVVAGGAGLARDEGRVTFVEGALPGERVRVAITQRKKDFARGHVVDVLMASPDRVEPPCPFVAAGCGGCDWQHVAPSAQRRLKGQIVTDALRRQARLDVEVDLGPDLPAAGYRTTLRGVAVDGRFGFRRRASHDVVEVGPCLVAHPLLEELVIDGRYPDGEVVLRAGAGTGERLVVVAGSGGGTTVPDGVRVVGEAALRSGTRAWYHEELAGQRWRVSARSFFQSRPDGAEALVTAVTAALDATPDDRRLVDLYGGVGLFALAVPASHVTLVEQGASSIADARVNLKGIDHRIVKADVEHWGPTHADAVVADPPRAGLGPKGVAKVVATGADRVALISCDPASLGRDARLLTESGYVLRNATVVDLFPHTSHVEVVSRFDRAGT